MNIFKTYKDQTKLIEEKYSNKEITRAYFGSLIAVLIIAVPVILVLVQLFSIFLMSPYFMEIIAAISIDILLVLFIVFKNAILKKYNAFDDIKYNFILIFEGIVISIFVIILALIVGFVIIPIFVL